MIFGLLLPPAVIVLVGLASALLARAPRAAHLVGAAGICAASLGGLAVVIAALVVGDTSSLTLPWNAVIGASFSVAFDPLTGFFLLPIYGLSAVCAVFGAGYLPHAFHGRGTAAHWLFYALLVSSMAFVVLARNAVLFLVAWEVMSLSSWQLVTFEHEREETRQAGLTYLVATQIGTAFLLVMFLAYHSVENIGIICLGLGVGLLGMSFGLPVVAFLGFAGGLLHVLNHALFKGLLFLGAGSASHAAGTREIDRLGGLLRRMPFTGAAFLVGAAAISGLPPLNGFVSELLVFLGAFNAAATGPALPAAAAGFVVAALALIGGLAVACFTKAFGISFLGEPRTPSAAAAKEAGASMLVPLVVLAAGCVGIGVLSPLAVAFLAPLAGALAGVDPSASAAFLGRAGAGFVQVTIAAGVLAAAAIGLSLLRAALLSRRTVRSAGTWDCGYTRPDARMQYTSSSFAQPLVGMFRFPLATRRHWAPITEHFPVKSEFSSHTPDLFAERVFRPAFAGIGLLLSRLRWLQHGRLQLYVLYLAATLLVLLVWKLR